MSNLQPKLKQICADIHNDKWMLWIKMVFKKKNAYYIIYLKGTNLLKSKYWSRFIGGDR